MKHYCFQALQFLINESLISNPFLFIIVAITFKPKLLLGLHFIYIMKATHPYLGLFFLISFYLLKYYQFFSNFPSIFALFLIINIIKMVTSKI